MHYSLGDHFRIGNKKPLDDKNIERMRGTAWLLNAVHSSGLSTQDFARMYVDRGRSASGLMRKWTKGEAHPVRHSALQVEKLLPGTLWVFDLDAWDLLKNVPVSTSVVERIIDMYSENGYWSFPSDAGPRSSRRPVLAEVMDTQRLVYRGDYWGFLGALAVTRLYESSGNDIKYISALKDLFRALPGVLREPWLRPLGESLMDQLLGLKARRFYMSLMFGVDERVIFSQTDDPAFEPHRDWWPRDPTTGKAIEPEDPVILSDIAPSLGVKTRTRTPPLAALTGKVESTQTRPT